MRSVPPSMWRSLNGIEGFKILQNLKNANLKINADKQGKHLESHRYYMAFTLFQQIHGKVIMLPPLYDVLLQLQGALINAVTPELRAVSVDVNTNKKDFLFFYYYDTEITEDLSLLSIESMTEVNLDPFEWTEESKIIHLDPSKKIPPIGKFAFLRKEPNLPEIKKENRAYLLKKTRPLVVLLLNMQEALLGKVTPKLRHVAVDLDSERKWLECRFTYDGEISEENLNLATSAIQEATSTFPEYQIDSHIRRVDFPDKSYSGVPSSESRTAAYMRQEFKY